MMEQVRVSRRLRMGHFSMRAQLTDAQMKHDVHAVITRFLERHYAWCFGTEAGGASPMNEMLAKAAKDAGLKFARPKGQDAWVLVDKGMVDDAWSVYYDQIVDPDGKRPGKHTARGVVGASFDNEGLGPVTLIPLHRLTQRSDPDGKKNRKLDAAVIDFARKRGRGKGLVFLGADINLNDRVRDAFPDSGLTSIGDELKKWVATGHGPIDTIYSYDPDSRVEAVSCRDVPDAEMFLYSDHKGYEAEFTVKLLRGPR